MNEKEVNRREFLNRFSSVAGATALGGAAYAAAPRLARADEAAKGTIPDTPVKFGWMSFTSGPGAALG